ncbi:MAG TPA: hypothetical protein PKZ32_19685 [Candidatus Melainabacteria bacterium]|nr:hypothetical protein [Candidatus Melainabacteria bacterium]
MIRFKCLLISLFFLYSILLVGQGACAQDDQVARAPQKLRISEVKDTKTCPAEPDDDSLLQKLLPAGRLKQIKLKSELEGLADRGVSQPWGGFLA